MTARRRPRRTRQHPAVLAAGLLAALWLALAIAHVLGWLLLAGAIAGGAYLAGRQRRSSTGPVPVQPVTPAATSANAHPRTGGPAPAGPGLLEVQLARVTAERDQLHARVADLERQLADLTDACHAAWDAAASVPPRPALARNEDAITRLLADPRGGARPLGAR